MDEFELEDKAIYLNTGTKVSIFRGKQVNGGAPVVVKKFDCSTTHTKSTIAKVNERIKEGLLQARLDHPNCLRLYEVRFEIPKKRDPLDKDSFVINHILESMESDVLQDITIRANERREYSEEELREFLVQMTGAVRYAYERVMDT